MCVFYERAIRIDDVLVPMSIWSSHSTESAPQWYMSKYKFGPILNFMFGVTCFPPLPCKLPMCCRAVAVSPTDRTRYGIIYLHGRLSIPVANANICEELARHHFLVVAPELPNSGTGSYDQPDLDADMIIKAVRDALDPSGQIMWGVLGYSAGARIACTCKLDFPLGRCAIAGYAEPICSERLRIFYSTKDDVFPLFNKHPPAAADVVLTHDEVHVAFQDPRFINLFALPGVLVWAVARLMGKVTFDLDRYVLYPNASHVEKWLVPAVLAFFMEEAS